MLMVFSQEVQMELMSMQLTPLLIEDILLQEMTSGAFVYTITQWYRTLNNAEE